MPAHVRSRWAGFATHSHMLRSRSLDFDAAKAQLVAWASRNGVAAVGVGSPWEPVSAAHYGHFERTERDRYFGGLVAADAVMDREPINALIADLNHRAGGATRFYLDNETPKNRYGHLWYVGFDYQVPAWHDYSQDRRVQFCDTDPATDLNALTGRPHRRRAYMEVVARQRRAGALAVWAHPTSWWRQDGAFVTNIAAEMVTHLHADGFLDGMVVQGYDACHRAYQALWFDLLDRGAAVPGFAELDACFDSLPIAAKGCFLNYVPCETTPPDLAQASAAMAAGRHFMSSGPHLTLTVDGQPSGSRIRSGAGERHRVVVTAWPAADESALAAVELLGPTGAVLATVPDFPGGSIEIDLTGGPRGGYVVARAFGQHDAPAVPRQQRIRHCALTNPVYLDTPATPKLVPVETRVALSVDPAGRAWNRPFRVLAADGEQMEQGVLRQRELVLRLPASARLELEMADGTRRDIPLAMANSRLRGHIDYLADGAFLEDWPSSASGDVPVAAFRFDAVREALREMALAL